MADRLTKGRDEPPVRSNLTGRENRSKMTRQRFCYWHTFLFLNNRSGVACLWTGGHCVCVASGGGGGSISPVFHEQDVAIREALAKVAARGGGTRGGGARSHSSPRTTPRA